MQFEQLRERTLTWARNKELLSSECINPQIRQMGEEFGELCKAIKLWDIDHIKEELGDNIVVLTILASQIGLDITKCFEVAVNKIEKRKGKTLSHSFVKEEDL